jgi:hypothetical protein
VNKLKSFIENTPTRWLALMTMVSVALIVIGLIIFPSILKLFLICIFLTVGYLISYLAVILIKDLING